MSVISRISDSGRRITYPPGGPGGGEEYDGAYPDGPPGNALGIYYYEIMSEEMFL